jgi:WD40 repeat protein
MVRFTSLQRALAAILLVVGLVHPVRATDQATKTRPQPAPLPGLVSSPRPLPGVGRWQLARKTPRGRIVALAWNRDATQIACSEQSYVRICDARTLKTETILVGHAKPVTAIDWNHATNRLASASCDGSVRIWSDKGRPERVLTGHTDEVNSVAWTKDGTRLASASSDGTVRIWNADGSAGPIIKASNAAVRCVAWSLDGRHLVSGDGNSLVKMWNADGSAGPLCKGHLGEVTAVAWSPDGRQFASSTYGYKEPNSETVYADVRIWKADGSPVATIPGDAASCGLCWNPDGLSLAVLDISQGAQGIRVCDLQGSVVNRIRMRPAALFLPIGLAWSPDGGEIAAGDFGSLTIFHLADGSMRRSPIGLRPRLSPRPAPLAIFSPNADKCFLRLSNDEPYQVWSADGRSGPKMSDRQITKPLWSPAGDQIAFVAGDNELRVWRVGSPATRLVTQATTPLEIIAWSPRGDALAVLEQSGTFRLVRADGVELLQRKIAAPEADPEPGSGVTDSVSRIVFRPDGKAVAVVARNAVDVIPVDGTAVKTLPFDNPASGGEGNGFWWSLDGLRLTSLRKREKATTQLVTWDLGSGKQDKITGFDDEVASFDCSPDGTRFLIGCDTGVWQLLRLDNLKSTPVEALGHVSAVRSAAFSHDGRRFATGGWDALIKVWSTDGKVQQTLFGNAWPVHGLAWSTDGKRLTSIERDRTQRLYSLETGRPELTIETAVDGGVMLMTADGRIFGRRPEQLDATFVALLEKPSGGMEIVEYTEFLKRTGQSDR